MNAGNAGGAFYGGDRGEVDGATGKGTMPRGGRPSGGRRERGGFGEDEENRREGDAGKAGGVEDCPEGRQRVGNG